LQGRLADAFQAQGDLGRAIEEYGKAVELEPALAGPWWGLGWLPTWVYHTMSWVILDSTASMSLRRQSLMSPVTTYNNTRLSTQGALSDRAALFRRSIRQRPLPVSRANWRRAAPITQSAGRSHLDIVPGLVVQWMLI
jgi:hypothetical protein